MWKEELEVRVYRTLRIQHRESVPKYCCPMDNLESAISVRQLLPLHFHQQAWFESEIRFNPHFDSGFNQLFTSSLLILLHLECEPRSATHYDMKGAIQKERRPLFPDCLDGRPILKFQFSQRSPALCFSLLVELN